MNKWEHRENNINECWEMEYLFILIGKLANENWKGFW
jgi:hypothetical protein